jgi:DTW domain-containing protein YfiP
MQKGLVVPDVMPLPRKRLLCASCERPMGQCLCGLVRPSRWTTEVLILQHPMESGHAKGTGWLLSRCLPRSKLMLGERWDEALLRQSLHGAWTAGEAPPEFGGTALLYPSVDASPGVPWDGASAPRRLVVLDATWRKSLKMLLLNPMLAGAAMAASSVSVVSNALLLQRWRPQPDASNSRTSWRS